MSGFDLGNSARVPVVAASDRSTELSSTQPIPFEFTSGPKDAKIVIVGEAWGQTEAEYKRPFAGESGKELFRILGDAWPQAEPELHQQACAHHRGSTAEWLRIREKWLKAVSVLMTNVIARRPLGNKFTEEFCCKKDQLPPGYGFGPIKLGAYLKPELLPEVQRLWHEIEQAQPNLVIAMGNVASWALIDRTNIDQIRGTLFVKRGVKVLPTYHPAAVLRKWEWRPIVLADCMKAWREAQFPEIRRPRRQIVINPSIQDIWGWIQQLDAEGLPPYLTCDVETEGGQITSIGFARSRDDALVVPFWDKTKPGLSYWPSLEEELEARQAVEFLLWLKVPKIFQNGMYDLQYILKERYRVRAVGDDTMLFHHSIFPEMRKGLGFLGSIYTDEPSWKLMRRQRADTEKKDE